MKILQQTYYIATLSDVTECQRATFKINCSILINSVRMKKNRECMKTTQIKEQRNQFAEHFHILDLFKDGSSKKKNHFARSLGKFILALSNKSEFWRVSS